MTHEIPSEQSREKYSYRIFHITNRSKDDSDDDGDNRKANGGESATAATKETGKQRRFSKKSFRMSNRNGLNAWKRRSTRNKRTPSMKKGSYSSTSNEHQTHLPATNKHDEPAHLSDSDALVEAFEATMANEDATLHNLLVRADELETTVKKQDFNKMQPTVRTSFSRQRKRILIVFGTIAIVLISLITVSIFITLLIIRYKRRTPSSH